MIYALWSLIALVAAGLGVTLGLFAVAVYLVWLEERSATDRGPADDSSSSGAPHPPLSAG